uniref:CA domain-containing protein n=1 Tax=Gongylonema pulchrum TaxID=637853 RepID=A0A183E847_9BILA
LQFVARDEAGDGDGDVEYRLINTEPSETFTVDPVTGIVQTAVRHYKPGETYRVFVQARDRTPTDYQVSQDSKVAVLEVYAGDRAPQFVEQQYRVYVPEDTQVGSSIVDVRAKRFKPIDKRRTKGELVYQLFLDASLPEREPSPYFAIDAAMGLVRLKKALDYDDDTQPKHHQLKGLSKLHFRNISVNLKMPYLSSNLLICSAMHAEDKDSGENARIVYSLSDDHFKINDRGEISAQKRLDADQNRERFYIYRFNVTATDRGEPPLSSTAAVHIRTENTNDEAPIFIPTGNYQAYVAEDAQGGTPVVQIQAIDPDRDQVNRDPLLLRAFFSFRLILKTIILDLQFC